MANGQSSQNTPPSSTDLSNTLAAILGLTGTPVPQGGVVSPGITGTPPPQVTAPPPGASLYDPRGAPAPGIQAPQQMPRQGIPSNPINQTGVNFPTKKARDAVVVSTGMEGIAQAIEHFKNKDNSDKMAKAQSTLDMFNAANAAGDTATANLLSSDPKIVKQWEKYLKLEFERVPVTQKSPAPPVAPGRTPPANQPGGIAVPRPSPQAQLSSAVQNIMIQGLKDKDPRVMASVLGPGFVLSPDDFRTATKAQFGIEMSPAQVKQLDIQSRQILATSVLDYTKFVTGKGMDAASRKEVEDARVRGNEEIARGHDAAIRYAADQRRLAVKDISKASPANVNLAIVKGQQTMYDGIAKAGMTAMANLEKLKPKDYQTDPLYNYYKQSVADAQSKSDGLKATYDNMQMEDTLPDPDDDSDTDQ